MNLKLISLLLLALVEIAAAASSAYVATTWPPGGSCSIPSAVAVLDLDSGRQTASVQIPRGASGVVFPRDGTRAYATSSESSVLSVLDGFSGEALASYPLPFQPGRIFLRLDGAAAYIENETGLAVVSPGDGSVLANIPLPSIAAAEAITGDGKRLYAALQNGNVAVIDTATNNLIAVVVTLSPLLFGIAISTDGATLWLSGYLSQTTTGVIVMNTADNTVLDSITLGANVGAMAIRGGSAYVLSDYSGGRVTVIDTASGAVTATVSLPANPAALALRPGGALYVTADGVVFGINTATNTLTRAVPTQNLIGCLAMSPDGKRAFGTMITEAVSVIDPSSKLVTTTIPAGADPVSVSLSVDGTRGAVASFRSRGLTVFDATTNKFLSASTLPYTANAVAMNPDGTRAYVATSGLFLVSGTLTVVDTATGSILANLPMPPVGTATAVPEALVVTPDGSKVYVSVSLIPFELPPPISGYTLVVSTASNSITGFLANAGGGGIAVGPAGRYVHAAGASRIYTINTRSDRIIATLNQRYASTLAVSPDGQWLYIGMPLSNEISVARTLTNRVVASIPFSNGPSGLAFTPDGTTVWATRAAASLSVIDTATRTVVDSVAPGGYSTGIAFSH